jgi:hypothetical protein
MGWCEQGRGSWLGSGSGRRVAGSGEAGPSRLRRAGLFCFGPPSVDVPYGRLAATCLFGLRGFAGYRAGRGWLDSGGCGCPRAISDRYCRVCSRANRVQGGSIDDIQSMSGIRSTIKNLKPTVLMPRRRTPSPALGR